MKKEENWIGRTPDETDPLLLYKYSILDDHKKDLLLNGEFYISSPADLNDPFDCRVGPDYSKVSDEQMMRHISHLMQDELSKLNATERTLKKRMWLNDFRTEWERKDFRDEANNRSNLGIDKNVGVLSFSLDDRNNALWGHYGNSHKGILIVFNFVDLFKSIKSELQEKQETAGLFYGPANYSGYPENIEPIQSFDPVYLGNYHKEIYLFKSPIWTFENEYRIIVFPTKIRIIQIPSTSIVEVIAGSKIEDNDFRDLLKICKGKIPVKKAYIKENSFDLNYELVQSVD